MKALKLDKLLDGRTLGMVRDGKQTDETGRPTLWDGRLTLVQGVDGVASRPIKASLYSNQDIRVLADGKTKLFPVTAVYADTGMCIRSPKLKQAIWDAMMAEVPTCDNVWSAEQ